LEEVAWKVPHSYECNTGEGGLVYVPVCDIVESKVSLSCLPSASGEAQ